MNKFWYLGNKSLDYGTKIGPHRVTDFFTRHRTQIDCWSSWKEEASIDVETGLMCPGQAPAGQTPERTWTCVWISFTQATVCFNTREPLRSSLEDNLTSDSINRSHWCAYVTEERRVCGMCVWDEGRRTVQALKHGLFSWASQCFCADPPSLLLCSSVSCC